MENIYFIIPTIDFENYKDYIIENTPSRFNIALTNTIIKLPVNAAIPEEMSNLTHYTHEEILVELEKPEWFINND